ncbi:MAG: two-component system sensor histidine kinase GlrK [Gammaproteobacteria bacterium]|jgi:two-component system sensor histidine kinase GlrK
MMRTLPPLIAAALPRSFMVLVVLGFLMVAAPLIAAFFLSSVEVGRLAHQGESVVYQAVQQAQATRVLLQQINAMDRLGRQYLEFGQAERLEQYQELRQAFALTLAPLVESEVFDEPNELSFEPLAQHEAQLFGIISGIARLTEKEVPASAQLAALVNEVRTAQSASKRKLDRAVEVMRDMAARAQGLIFWQAVGLIPMAVVLAVIAFVIIRRAAQHIDAAIRQLGDNDLERPIRISGPRDVELLGERLEWLRVRLRELEQQKRRFLQHVSHELKTPLTAVREGSDLLAEQIVGPLNEAQIEVSRILRTNTLRLQKLIEDMLISSRLAELGKRSIAGDLVALHQVVEDVVADHRLSISRKTLSVHANLEPIDLVGDATSLRTVVDNLVSNAIKYSPHNGQIVLDLRVSGDSVIFDVQDSGTGIVPGEEEQIFEAFNQSREQPPGPVRGTGLGLAIAREFAHHHRGEISVLDSGGGAHFRMTLPYCRGGERRDG